MADRLSQVYRLLRTSGPRAVCGTAARRLVALARMRSLTRRLREVATLEAAVASVTGIGVKPGDLIFAMQKPAEILEFLRLVAEPAPQVVVEIGTAAAGVLYLLSRIAARDALLISIDLPGGAFGGGYSAWRKPIYRRLARPGQELMLLRGSSHDLSIRERMDALLEGRPIDLLFIDGDHTLEGALSDLNFYGALVRPGSWIALHDICPNPSAPEIEVPILWGRLAHLPSSRALVDPAPPPGYGIGLIQVQGTINETLGDLNQTRK